MAHTDHCPRLRFVGTGDAVGSGGRFQPCLALDGPDQIILLDCGGTSLTALQAQGIDPLRVVGVVLTRLRADHAGGVPFLIQHGRLHQRRAPLVIWGPAGTERWLEQALALAVPSDPDAPGFALTVVELVPGAESVTGAEHGVPDVAVRGVAVDGGALAVRVTTGDHTVAYSGSTSWSPALTGFGHRAEVVVIEAYTWATPVPGHMSHAEIVEHHDEMGAARVLVMGCSPDMLARLTDPQAYPAPADADIVDL